VHGRKLSFAQKAPIGNIVRNMARLQFERRVKQMHPTSIMREDHKGWVIPGPMC
jgi:hypothetical protein